MTARPPTYASCSPSIRATASHSNDFSRILFLQRKYQEAVKTLQSVLAIDPEDLQAHYNLMLCYNGLGNEGAGQRARIPLPAL